METKSILLKSSRFLLFLLISVCPAATGKIIYVDDDSPTDFNKIQEIQKLEGTFVCYDVLFESGNCITVAENHYFMTESGHWIALYNLKAGAMLRTSKGSVGVKKITKQPKLYKGVVYNLKIEGSDQYLIGEDAVVVRDY